MKGRREWSPAQRAVRDQVLTVLRDHGELPVGEIGAKVAQVLTVNTIHESTSVRNLRDRGLYVEDFSPTNAIASGGRTPSGTMTNHLLVLVTAGLVQVRRETPKSIKLWSLTSTAKASLVSLQDMPPLEIHAEGSEA